MKWIWPLSAVLLFAVLTDWVQADWPQTVFRAGACFLCAAWLIVWGARGGEIRTSLTLVPFAALAAWGAAQLAVSSTVSNFLTTRSALAWAALLALYFVALQIRPLRSLLPAIAIFGGLFSLFASVQFFTSAGKVFWLVPGIGDERILGTFLNQNHYAALMELLFPVALWRFFRDSNKALYLGCAIVMFASVAAGGSRMGIALLLLELLVVGLRASHRPLLVLGAALAIGALAIAAEWPRVEQLRTAVPYESRNATGRASLEMIRARPLLGFGLGTWAQVYPSYATIDTGFRLIHADNDWLEWAAEGGIPFVLFLLAIAAIAVRSAWLEPWSAGCAAVLLHAIVEFPMHKQAVWAWFIVLLATAQRGKESSARRKLSS